MFSMLQKIHLHTWISWFCEEEKLKRCSERECSDEADNLIWDLWCINSWISVSADNKVHKKESLCASWWGHRMCARSTYWSGSVFLGGSSSGRRRCGSKFLFLPLELDASSTNKHRMSCLLLFFLLMTPTQPHIAHALAKSSKEFKSVTNTCRSWCKKH